VSERDLPGSVEAMKRDLFPHADQATVEGADHQVAATHPDDVAQLLVEQFCRHPRRGLA
jgi:pimeloyl-ACP methyl ester carboxylesterase